MALVRLLCDAFKFLKASKGATVKQISQYIENNIKEMGPIRGNISVKIQKTLDNAIKRGLVESYRRRYILTPDGYLFRECGFRRRRISRSSGRSQRTKSRRCKPLRRKTTMTMEIRGSRSRSKGRLMRKESKSARSMMKHGKGRPMKCTRKNTKSRSRKQQGKRELMKRILKNRRSKSKGQQGKYERIRNKGRREEAKVTRHTKNKKHVTFLYAKEGNHSTKKMNY